MSTQKNRHSALPRHGDQENRQSGPSGSATELNGPTRWRRELEQAHLAIEDMNERIIELARRNEELSEKLKEETHLREEIERQLDKLRSQPPVNYTEVAALRHQLSLTVEELQIMQEELQAAHDELSAMQRQQNL